jgi:uncharacterized Fe-S cluster-containing MiaB family protein
MINMLIDSLATMKKSNLVDVTSLCLSNVRRNTFM